MEFGAKFLVVLVAIILWVALSTRFNRREGARGDLGNLQLAVRPWGVGETLTEPIIRYELVQKLGPDVKVIVLPAGQNFILGPEILGVTP